MNKIDLNTLNRWQKKDQKKFKLYASNFIDIQ